MLKRFSATLLMLALILQLLPTLSVQPANAAASGYFTFPKESSDPTSPRITTNGLVNLEGSINNVDLSSVSYSVFQIVKVNDPKDPSKDSIGSKTEGIKGGIYINGYTFSVNNIQLYSGLNQITFKGLQGGAEVSTSIYIQYHDGPVFYNLAARLDGNSFAINENGTTVVQSASSRGRTTADIAITGNAPNAQNVMVEVNGSSRSYTVSPSNNYEFTLSPLTLKKGKNQVTITVSNNGQSLVTKREIAFYNGEVTFYDVNLNDTVSKASAALEYSPNFQTDNADKPANLTVTGTVIVPNNFKTNPTTGAVTPNPDPAQPLQINPTLNGVSLQ